MIGARDGLLECELRCERRSGGRRMGLPFLDELADLILERGELRDLLLDAPEERDDVIPPRRPILPGQPGIKTLIDRVKPPPEARVCGVVHHFADVAAAATA